MKKNENLFSCGKINKYFMIPFLCPISCFLTNLFLDLYAKEYNNYTMLIKKKPFLFSIFTPLAYLGGGLLYFIASIRIKTESTKKSSENKKDKEANETSSSYSIEYIYNNPLKINNLKKFSILFIMSLFVNINIFFHFISFKENKENKENTENTENNVFEPRLFFLILIPIFSKIILKSELYRHQFLSLFISIIGIFILLIPTALKIKEKSEIIINILVFVSAAISSIYLVVIKHLTHKYFLSPYLCLFYIGIFSFITLLVGYIIYYSINDNDYNFIDNFRDESFISSLYFILMFIFCLILNVLTFLVIYFFSPTLLMITDIISPILSLIYKGIITEEKNFETLDIILIIIGYSIVLFFSLIYNEIIICNFFGLNRNTKKFLEREQRNELSSIIDGDVDDDDNDNNKDTDDEPIKLKNELIN